MHALDIAQHEVAMYQVGFETYCSNKSEYHIYFVWQSAEYTIKEHDGCYGEWYVEHTFNKQRKMSVAYLLKIQTCAEG